MIPPKPTFTVSVDLGPPSEHTALAILERPTAERTVKEPVFRLRHVERLRPGTPYATIVDRVTTMMTDEALSGSPVVLDLTGVGHALLEQFRKAKPRPRVVPVIVIAGAVPPHNENGTWFVPKIELVTRLQLVLQTRRLKIAPNLPDAALLTNELMAFRLRTIPLGDAPVNWREGRQDDMVLAVALAVWHAERNPPMGFAPYALGGAYEVDQAPPGVFNT